MVFIVHIVLLYRDSEVPFEFFIELSFRFPIVLGER